MIVLSSADEAVFIISRSGKPMLLVGNNRYYRHSSYKEGSLKCLYVCVKWSSGCRSSITTFNDEIVKYGKEHKHI
ncbi:unnamed protein product [Pieris macdunnoughi]|uniref:FLYWCH-type domain-containing protein n=1 Tax=Pieris macdunnoughi TaxID=345717 RepID=A0A821QAE8_9NEOP|nr:unnamed protein product [Pieris macdunnoughi]